MLRHYYALVAFALLCAGCGGGGKLASVSGRVTLNGKPLENAAVMFQPVAEKTQDPGPGSTGVTDADGRYTLSVVGSNRKGAVVGKHMVRITMYEKDDSADDRPKPKSKRLPPRYNRQTTLEFTVPSGGSDKADFPLTEP
jgi:hypothetical protein